jgi:carboxypeptidase Taq
VLQDVHWASGYIGYFSTYSLGNLMASMLWEKIVQDIPNIDGLVEQAQFGDLLAWLRENVHQHGAKYKPADLIMRVTGKALTPEPYIQYLTDKFSEIYGL